MLLDESIKCRDLPMIRDNIRRIIGDFMRGRHPQIVDAAINIVFEKVQKQLDKFAPDNQKCNGAYFMTVIQNAARKWLNSTKYYRIADAIEAKASICDEGYDLAQHADGPRKRPDDSDSDSGDYSELFGLCETEAEVLLIDNLRLQKGIYKMRSARAYEADKGAALYRRDIAPPGMVDPLATLISFAELTIDNFAEIAEEERIKRIRAKTRRC